MKVLRATDLVVLAIAALAIVTTARKFGVTDPVAIVMLSVGWTCPAASRLIAWRLGHHAGRQMQLDDPLRAAAVLMVGAAPWLLLPVIQEIHPVSFLTTVDSVPWIRMAGAGFAMGGVLGPVWCRHATGTTSFWQTRIWPEGPDFSPTSKPC